MSVESPAQIADRVAWMNLGKAHDDLQPKAYPKVGSVIECQWLPHGKSVPDGWNQAPTSKSHHDAHAVLIERKVSA